MSQPFIGSRVNAEQLDKATQSVLDKNEVLVGIFAGSARKSKPDGTMTDLTTSFGRDYLLVTDRRLVFWARGIFGEATAAFSYTHISTVEGEQFFGGGQVVINTGGQKGLFTAMSKNEVPTALQMIREQMDRHKRGRAQGSAEDMIMEQIRKLGELHASGILTDQEFQAKKADLLSRL
jgi:hypothetical protein